jgi:hypothetical protein
MESAVVFTRQADDVEAGRDLSHMIAEALPGRPPDAVVVFAAPHYGHERLLEALHTACRPKVLVGASSAGEFTGEVRAEGAACALALRADDVLFTAGLGRGLSRDPAAAARQLVSTFHGLNNSTYPHRSALVMADALAGHTDELVDELTVATSGQYQFFGGGAGDNAQFQRTQVFLGTQALSDAVVGLEILSHKPIGIGVSHGWEPAGVGLRVTEVDGARLVSLNGLPAVEAFQDHAEQTRQALDTSAPIPFFLHNILGIDTGSGYRLRVPLVINADGSVLCASAIPAGTIVHIMRSSEKSAVVAAEQATRSALLALGGLRPKAALFFDCVATRLRMGDAFDFEVKAIGERLGNIDLVGCNTHGQIARAEGQFNGFHNCTAVVCVIPE